ncbi:DExH-box ATP-dependent RNA helicase DExH18, mitochondrial-like isoform X2 [Coffea arabica]|uniref:ATP-dependent RNA helicase SUV3L, mitochondrial n=1 Tax=Coffea arabica TaxID=13443 RepID=A0A6P6TAL7_COFAR|nr:DExH-box ATP-dependent RNA helicase DExH18, mitochondrial-like isoform X2 [Coffea arabica]XP_027075487.1 DExH-box ATP-dependent RNA helicase DExH18, mitochondrial-like isoform X2 [Coffea arabica]XP_027075488.1 DExH-box ATP-dependent RNA helicase DExH18, mitochondrial-like isoform X2 [Coffea arabica]XP_027079094.1 DExH-box ATP-dependent RNA helicase DExH18, mitochondrial-like isoform X2 [Coffea arabica]XP_027079095.1 DExH-box ATP-dependent RNA helicase DExH18, mitochondrial-like isoform X2 [C
MARGPARNLLYLYSSRDNFTKVRAFLLPNRFHRADSPNPSNSHPFLTPDSKFCIPPQFSPSHFTQSLNYRCLNFQRHPFSTLVENGTPNLNSAPALESEVTEVDSISDIGLDENGPGNENLEPEKRLNFAQIASRDPVEIYKELRDASKSDKQSRSDWDLLIEVFRGFAKSGWASNQALAVYIGASFFPTAAHKFRNFFFKKCKIDIVKYLVFLAPGIEAEKFLFPIFVEFCLEEFPDEIKRFRSMVESADLTKPHTWFPFARAMKRKIVYHCGPTNSGKTYNALQRFMEAKKGIYCSPLRLLAMEVFDKVNALGVYCSLLTGQEKKYVPFSNHVACTVEMVSVDELYEVAVIDEIQMMADPSRGDAWTRALLGLKADEIHLCGDPSVLNIVRKICSETGDELVEQRYDRFKPLVVEAKTLLGDLKNVKSGDCIVAFSRREIFEVKLAIEKYTKHRCCVIYGALPPETRRQQANLFNDDNNEYDILVASDAVGMGLNLHIRRVVFYSLSKYNGDKTVPVPASQVKQIAGRAGRRGSRYPEGLTTTLHLEDLDYLIECLKKPFDEVKKVGLFPFFEQVELFAGQFPDVTFAQLLEKFAENCRLDGSYFLCHHHHIKKIANMLEKVQGLSLEDRFNFCFAPVNIRDPKAMYHLLRFASSYAHKVPVNIAMGMPKCIARNDSELLDLETKHQVLSMYLWLSNHFEEEKFPYVKKVEAMAVDIAELLGESLTKANWKPESRNPGKPRQQENEGGYERPRSLIKLYEQKRQEGFSAGQKLEKVTA